ncbi:MAG: Asp-tRNA(Asn)/Glu-tRNA(Gln) amidotransferase subunit GatA [Crocinitomicaceae bacterium]|nr:Asp-tRNA(Asn)/Glu-tRNA(Gln) amidotransferase subunit GatA [Crocinitomicaceae bacterium]
MLNSFASVQEALDSGKSVSDILEHYLLEIEKNKHLNAFLEVFEESARASAKEVDEKRAAGNAGKLAGMVIGIKDNMAYKGHKVSSGSKILEGFESLYTATAVQRLIDEDAIIIGRLNCDEFAMGSSNENSAYGKVLNPNNEKTVPGGSSGGSSAAMAAGLCTATLGSDTGGSIRQPASFTGTVGFKPTYGRISRFGLLAYASSFDQIGTFTSNVEDATLLTSIMAGMDEYDSTLIQEPQKAYSIEAPKEKLKIAYIKDCFNSEGINPIVKAKSEAILEKLKAEGHEVAGVDFPYLDIMVPTYYVLTTAEASSNLSRYDGVHYGYRAQDAEGVEPTYKKSRAEGFGEEVKRRIMLGTFVLSQGYYDAYYTKAQKVRRLIQDKTKEIFKDYDFIISPTTPDVAFEFGANSADPITMYLQDIFTVQANLAGNPAISLPLSEDENGMPFGLHVMGASKDDENLLGFSAYLMNK